MEKKFDFDDITLYPSKRTYIKSRKDIYPYHITRDNNVFLPLISAPMDSLFNIENKHFNRGFFHDLRKNNIDVTYPRAHKGQVNETDFISYSLNEFIDSFLEKRAAFDKEYVLIDIANGHLNHYMEAVKEVKEKYGDRLTIMVGNIANPETYAEWAEIGVDYVRCGIGGGAGCTTSANVSIHYPMGSLIKECYDLKLAFDYKTKIVADGGMKSFSDIIKALALGADYVMMGSMLNKTLESDSIPYLWKKIPIKNKKFARWLFDNGYSLHKKYRGMSTKEVQKIWGKEKLTTSEGITKWNKVEYTLNGWVDNFKDYLRSAMSYCDCKTLNEFVGSQQFVFISNNSLNRFKK